MKKTILALLLAAMSTGAMAGPVEGELFGYRLGEKYPVGPQTKFEEGNLIAAKIIVADKPQKPEDFGPVKVMATPKSFTIFYVFADTEFADEEKAKAFAKHYAELLGTKYGSKCTQRRVDAEWGSLNMLCAKQYELSVRYFIGTTEAHGVRIGLEAAGGSVSTALSDKLAGEALQLQKDAKTNNLERAEKEKKLKGL